MFGRSLFVGYSCDESANRWIERWLGECVYSTWDTAAFVIGLSSVWFWLIAQLPQFINNFMRSAADALSPWFLAQWLVGDSFNFLGCILSGDQLKTQTITAGYFIFSDVVIISQYLYYHVRNRKALDLDDSKHKGSSCFNFLNEPDSGNLTCNKASDLKTFICNDSMKLLQAVTPLDTKRHECWIFEHQYHLRRLGVEQNLECGQSMAERLTILYNKHKKCCSNCNPNKGVAKSIFKSRFSYKVLLGFMGFVGMVSIPKIQRTLIFREPQSIRRDTLSSRRALLASFSAGAAAREDFTLSESGQTRVVYFGAQLLHGNQQTHSWEHMAGGFLGWCSSALYLGSRLSQLIKNRQRRSVEGLSLAMVTCAILANVTYGVSIIMRSPSWDKLIIKAPWLLGSCGTVFLDLIILLQAYHYSQYSKGETKEFIPLLS